VHQLRRLSRCRWYGCGSGSGTRTRARRGQPERENDRPNAKRPP
jgi:hypothetical protein